MHFTFFTKERKQKRGFILLLSVLIASIILAISLGVYALSIKEVILASFLHDSALAFGAADRAIECTLFCDRSAPQNGMPYTIFSSSTSYVTPGALANAMCDAQLLTGASSNWTVVNNPANTGTPQFTLAYPDNTCADVSVFKEGNSTTTITSNGYNNCDPNSLRRTQRSIEVQGNF